jgi:hypothetical protein
LVGRKAVALQNIIEQTVVGLGYQLVDIERSAGGLLRITIDKIWEGSSSLEPILFLLSPGSDPTSTVEELSKKKKKFPLKAVSMGEG